MANTTKMLALVLTDGKGNVYYFSNAAFGTLPTDTPANQRFAARIANDPTYSKEIGLRIWGGGRSAVTFGYFDIINEDGAYDDLFTSAPFDEMTAEISILFDTISWNNRSVISESLVVDSIVPIGEDYLRVSFRDKAKALDKAIGTIYPQATNNATIRGQSKPVAIGKFSQHMPVKVNVSLNLMDVHDEDAFHWNTLAVKSRAVAAIKNTDWRVAINSQVHGIEYLVSMAGGDPFTCAAYGALQLDSQLVTSANGGAFTTWSGLPTLLPTGWSLVGTMSAGTKDFTNSSGACRCRVTSAGAVIGLRKTSITIPANGIILFSFDIVSSAVSGVITVRHLTSGAVTISQKNITINGTGHYADSFDVGANTGSLLQFEIGGGNIDCVIDNFFVWACSDTATPARAANFIANTRCGVPIDSSSWGALSIAGFTGSVGIVASGDKMASDLLDDLAASYTAWWWIDFSGNVAVKQLYDPIVVGSPTIFLTSGQIVAGQDIQADIDTCPGMSSSWAYDRNWHVMGDSDFAGSVSAADRELYSADFQQVGYLTVSPGYNALYNHIVGAPPIETVLTGMNVPSVEPDRLNGIYSIVRSFKTVPIVISDATLLQAELGECVSLDLARFGFDAQSHVLVGATGSLLAAVVTIKLWS